MVNPLGLIKRIFYEIKKKGFETEVKVKQNKQTKLLVNEIQ